MAGVRTAVTLSILVFSSTGCSWLFMTRSPAEVAAPDQPIECTSSQAAPILDTICFAYFVGMTSLAAGMPNCTPSGANEGLCYSDPGRRAPAIAISAGLMAFCGAAALSGYSASHRCNHVTHLNARCMGGDRSACDEIRPGWNVTVPNPR